MPQVAAKPRAILVVEAILLEGVAQLEVLLKRPEVVDLRHRLQLLHLHQAVLLFLLVAVEATCSDLRVDCWPLPCFEELDAFMPFTSYH